MRTASDGSSSSGSSGISGSSSSSGSIIRKEEAVLVSAGVVVEVVVV